MKAVSRDELAALRRMRACLAGIRDLDPAGVTARLADMDGQIARLEELLCGEREDEKRRRIEIIPIGAAAAVRAA